MRSTSARLIRCSNSQRFLLSLGVVGVSLISVLVVAVLAFTTPLVAPGSIFELEGNATVDTNTPGCDWDTLNGSNSGVNTTTPAGTCPSASIATLNAYSFVTGPSSPTNFTTGGSKDSHDISDWAFTTTSTPDKDTLTNGYAASYGVNVAGDTTHPIHKVLEFGAERFAQNGDSNIGIWFFQNPIGTTPGTKGSFTGVHAVGDILVVSAFTQGGGTSTISVYEWDPVTCPNSHYPSVPDGITTPQCADMNLLALFSDTNGGASVCNSSSPACAFVNSGPISVTWNYLSKFGTSGTVPSGGFYEGGLDLTSLFPSGQNVPCFSSFLFETRSSQSTDAVLKDFLLGSFPECKMKITKNCACVAFSSTSKQYTNAYNGTVSNDGGGTLTNVMVTDQGATYSCGSLAPKGATGDHKNFGRTSLGSPGLSTDCTISGATDSTFTSTSVGVTNQATTTASTGASTISAQTNMVSCPELVSGVSCSPSPALSVDKVCVTALVSNGTNVVVRVDYTGQVHNTGNVNITGVQVLETDNSTAGGATFSVGTLTKNGTTGADKCYTYTTVSGLTQPNCPSLVLPSFNSSPVAGAASYFPSTGTGVTPGRVQFSDTVRATGTDVYGNSVESHSAGSGVTANCLICPFGACPTQ